MKPAITSVLSGAVLILAFGGVRALRGDQGEPSPRDNAGEQMKVLGPAMALKLRHTHELITALAVEDFDRLADNALTLKRIGRDTLWKVSPNLNYVKYSSEFAAIADELARCAREHDLNGATLSYVRLTINCVDCHKYVRDNRILDPKLRGR
jgi:hypothetical protein